MIRSVLQFCVAVSILGGCLSTGYAQSLQDALGGIFNEVLAGRFDVTQTGEHGTHFNQSQNELSQSTITAFSNSITSTIGSFPLSSTSAGLTFDFSSGQPVSTSTSLGPIFTERAATLGKSRFNMGVNFTRLSLNKLRGVNLSDTRFTFLHQDVGLPGLGDSWNEYDTVDLFMRDMNLDATVIAFVGSFGITDRIDIGVAIPLVNLQMDVQPVVVINSFTNVYLGGDPQHFYGDSLAPVLVESLDPVKQSAAGIGDMALRAKYNFVHDAALNMAALVEYRLSTGDSADFLGTGSEAFKASLIFSGSIGNFSPHANLGYQVNNSDLDRNEIEVFVGFDQKVSETFTVAFDVLAEIEVGESQALVFPDEALVEGFLPRDTTDPTQGTFWQREVFSLTNIPNFKKDHIINAALGFKVNPKEGLIVVANVFVPLNDGGLRSNFIPTLGFEFSF